MVLVFVDRANYRFKISHQHALPDVSSSRIVQGAGFFDKIKAAIRKGKNFMANNIPLVKEIIGTAVKIANKTPGVINDSIVATSKILGQAAEMGVPIPGAIKYGLNKTAGVAMDVANKIDNVTNSKKFKQVNGIVNNVLEKTSRMVEQQKANDPVYTGNGLLQREAPAKKKGGRKPKADNAALLKLIATMSSKI